MFWNLVMLTKIVYLFLFVLPVNFIKIVSCNIDELLDGLDLFVNYLKMTPIKSQA